MMLSIDGSFHSGGGQILRTSLGLSALLKQPFEIANIRSGRQNPGLRPQHLACVNAVAKLCSAYAEGAEVGSQDLKFYPRDARGKPLNVGIGTAGSITLLAQSLLLPAFFAVKNFKLKAAGGTDVPFSPPSTYFSEVLLPHLRKFCGKTEYNVTRRGFVPVGAGKANFFVRPKFSLASHGSFSEFLASLRANPVARVNLLNQGKLLCVRGVSIASNDLQNAEVAERQARAARLALGKLGVPVDISSEYSVSESAGSAITLWAVFSDGDEVSQTNPVILGASCLGERGKKSEDIGNEAAKKLMAEIEAKAPVDSHLADQLLPFLALAGGSMKVPEITSHCFANMYVIEQFLGKCFEVDAEKKIISVA